MFNERYGLNDAVLEGYKKNTRRAEFSAEEQQVLNEADDVYMDGDYVVAHFDSGVGDVRFGTRYKVGEVVAVAQSYEMIRNCMTIGDPLLPEWTASSAGWRNKMFVKAELMPHRIRIAGVRAERLQDISDEDCIKEGIYKDECTTYFNGYGFELEHLEKGLVLAKRWYDTPRQSFAALIDKVSGRGTWASNPWVVAYEFELIK